MNSDQSSQHKASLRSKIGNGGITLAILSK